MEKVTEASHGNPPLALKSNEVLGRTRADVAVLFARADSHYKALPGVEVYDMERDARTYDGPWPVVAHPPCRAWGRLRTFARPRPDERNLARLACALVREYGGVLEHPAGSTLWPAQRLPRPGERDAFRGWTLAAPQKWWGHLAEKDTWFYVVGCEPGEMPVMPSRWQQPRMWCRATSAATRARMSAKPSAKRRRPSWLCGWWSWRGAAMCGPT